MATEQELPEADAPDETIRTEVIALLEEEDVLPMKAYGVGGARFVYEKLSEGQVPFDGETTNYHLDPGTGTATEAPDDARFAGVGRLGVLYALAPVAWTLRQSLPGGRRDTVRLRVYEPDGEDDDRTGDRPTVVYFHGGGFVVGSIDAYDDLCGALAEAAGATVVSVGYRLTPEHPHPTPKRDAYAAFEWAAGQFGGDGPLVVAGDSAGGTLASLTAITARDRDGPEIDQQWLVYPSASRRTDRDSYRENAEGYVLETRDVEWFRSHRFGEEGVVDPPAYPLDADDLSGLPETTVVTAGFDPLRDEGVALARSLADAGVTVDHRHYPEMVHGFLGILEDPSVDRAWETVEYLGEKVRSRRPGRGNADT